MDHTVCTLNFGCRANQADGAAIDAELLQRGFRIGHDPASAEFVVLNSCTVTNAADADLRAAVRRIRKQNPAARILVTGCYAQREAAQIATLPGVTWVVGNSHKNEIARLISDSVGGTEQFVPVQQLTRSDRCRDFVSSSDAGRLGSITPAARLLVGDISEQREFRSAPYWGSVTEDRTRPNLKIQDGCNSKCSFCIIPSVRGRSRSLPPDDVVAQVKSLVDAGYLEVVLSGVNLGQYGRDCSPRTSFKDVLCRILDQTGVCRLRISSVEPMDWTDALLRVMASTPRIAPHVHAPLQSGSDRILRRMRRKYRAAQYRERIIAAAERLPNGAFGADVIVGFPGETESDFEQTRRLIEELPLTYLHVFSYSRRPGTAADGMKDHLPGDIVRERNRILRELAAVKNRAFRERQIGGVLNVLTLDSPEDRGIGLSENYLRVEVPGEACGANQLRQVMISGLTNIGLTGICC